MRITTMIDDALREINVINAVDEAQPQDHAFALRKLNRIVDLYNTQHLLNSFMENVSFCEPGEGWTSPIHIGVNHQFPTTAPTHIESAFFRQGGATDYPLRSMTAGQWAKIAYKPIKAIPSYYYAQKMNENTVKIHFDCIPLPGLELHILAKFPHGDGTGFKVTDDVVFGYGNEKLLIDRLALELCTPYEIDSKTAGELAAKVQEAENKIKAYNYEPSVLTPSSTLRKRKRVKNRARF